MDIQPIRREVTISKRGACRTHVEFDRDPNHWGKSKRKNQPRTYTRVTPASAGRLDNAIWRLIYSDHAVAIPFTWPGMLEVNIRTD